MQQDSYLRDNLKDLKSALNEVGVVGVVAVGVGVEEAVLGSRGVLGVVLVVVAVARW